MKHEEILVYTTLVIVLLLNLTGVVFSWVKNSEELPTVRDSIKTFDSLGYFYENAGQINDDEVFFFGPFIGGMIGFSTSRIFIWLNEVKEPIEILFFNSNTVSPRANGQANHKMNYFLGSRGTFTDIDVFDSISYDELWKGISLIYKNSENGAKYEFLVEAGADISDIQIVCNNQDLLIVNSESIAIKKEHRILNDYGLKVYEEGKELAACFNQLDSQSYGFLIPNHDLSKSLVIDPLIFSTYIGGASDDVGECIEVDSEGNVYVAGYTSSADFLGDFESQGSDDCFVLKLDSSGSSLEYCTLIGGVGSDQPLDITIDSSGNVYVTGESSSIDFPTFNAFNETLAGGSDCFVFKLSSNGSSLIYSTLIGDMEQDKGNGIAVDSSGFAYVTGTTYCTRTESGFPTNNAYDNTYNGPLKDSFVFKLSQDGSSLVYSTLVGGNGGDMGLCISIDDSGCVYVAGITSSTDFPMVNPYDDTRNSDPLDVGDLMIFKLNAEGNDIVYSSYFGGINGEYVFEIEVDEDNNIFIVGATKSPNYPTTTNAFDTEYNGGWSDCFVTKFYADGSGLHYSTLVGGSGLDMAYSLEIDDEGNAIVAGYSDSENFPIINGISDSPYGDYDSIAFILDSNGSELSYSSYFGGEKKDFAYGVALDNDGNIYLTGRTESSNLSTTEGYDDTINGEVDCFIAKLQPYETESEQYPVEIILAGIGAIAIVLVLVVVKMKR